MSLDELARASCAIYVDGHREGTGTLVTDSHVLTAAHVLRRGGPLAIRFRDGILGEAIPVERIPLGDHAGEIDIAVLMLGPGPDRPLPGKLWPARRLPTETKAFGYPKAEGAAPWGVWRDSTVGGTVGGGRVQLDWRDVGTLVGHSGGPVCDKQSGLMVGVLVEGSEAGHFDRFVPLPVIRSAWKDLPRPWLFAGENALTHFTQRATGQRSIARGGDLFRGRHEALAIVRRWLRADAGPGIPLVITAQPGGGKSAVLSRAALEIERTGNCDGVAFHARHAVVGAFIDALSAACGVDATSSWQELVAALTARETQEVMVLAVDALDETAGEQDRADLRQALRELARLDWLRIAVATRPLSARDIYRPGGHLHRLGVLSGATSRNLVDLDADRFFDAEDLIAYIETLLGQDGFANPGPPGGAWEAYRQNPDARSQLARIVADHADRNYLVAGMSAFQLAEDSEILRPGSVMFDPSAVPSTIGEALGKYFEGLPANRRKREAGLLTALAYARGAGLDDKRWLAFAHALGYEDVNGDALAELKDGAAADYLLESGTDPGGVVTRLFHQALADELTAGRDRRSDEIRLVQLLRAENGDGGWLAASAYTWNNAPSHAAEAGLLGQLAGEADFLVAMAPAAMRSAVRGLQVGSRQDPVSIYEVALPFLGDELGMNAAVLEVVSQAQGNRALAQALHDVGVERPYRVTGAIRPFDRALNGVDGHTATVHGVAVLRWPRLDHPVIVTASADGTARVWDPHGQDRELARFEGHDGPVTAVASLMWPGLGHEVIVTASADATARVWDPLDAAQELARFDGHAAAVQGVASLSWPGLDHPVVVTTSADTTARVWDPLDPGRELARFDGHRNDVQGVAVLAWPGLDHPVVVTTSWDDTARVWDPVQPGRELARCDLHTDDLQGVAVLAWPGLDHPTIVTTSYDATARVWDPLDPGRELARFDGHTGAVLAAAVLPWPGLEHPVIVTASADVTAQVWDPHEPSRELARFDGHSGGVRGVAALPWPGLDHPVIVTASTDATAQVWDPHGADRGPAPAPGHAAGFMGVAALDWPGLDHPVIVTASTDKTARIWDPAQPGHELARFGGHTGWVWAVTTLDWPGLDHPVIVTASTDRTARVWDPRDPGQELARFDGHTGKVWAVTTLDWPGLDHPVIVTGSADETARVWDPRQPGRELARFDGHTSAVQGVATLRWPDRDHPVIVTVALDGTARVWDPREPGRELARFGGHTGWVWAVTSLDWPGLDHPVIVTAATDGTARVWDPCDPGRELARLDGHTGWVWAVTSLDWPGLDHPVIVTTSLDRTARVWDPRAPRTAVASFALLGEGHSIAVLDPATLAITSSRGFLVFELEAGEHRRRK